MTDSYKQTDDENKLALIKKVIDKEQRLVKAMSLLVEIIMEETPEDYNVDFREGDEKCLICYDHTTRELSYQVLLTKEPLSFLPYCSAETFHRVQERVTHELIDIIWGYGLAEDLHG